MKQYLKSVTSIGSFKRENQQGQAAFIHNCLHKVMKPLCVVVLATGMLFAAGQAFAATQVTVNTKILNVRSDAGTNFSKVASVSQGEVFTAIAEKNGWYQIVLPEGKVGWVSKDYVLTAVNLYPERVTVVSGSVNIRSGPDTTYSKIGDLTAGVSLQVLGKTKDWYSVYLTDGKTVGWIASWLVKSADEDSEPATPVQPSDDGQVVTVGRQGRVNAAALSVRKTASDNGAKIATISSGTVVNILEEKGKATDQGNCWYRISAGNTTGWVRSCYVETIGAAKSAYVPAAKSDLSWVAEETALSSGEIKRESVSYGTKLRITAGEKLHYRMESIPDGVMIYVDAKLQGELSSAQQNSVSVAYGNESHSILKIIWIGKQYIAVAPGEDGKSLEIKIGSSPLIGRFIVLDPGHGTYTAASGSGMDSGAVGTGGLHEQIVTLDIGKKVRAYLEGRGATVVMTRTGGTYLTLVERAWMANALDSDIFVSIHTNSSVSKTAKGSATYYYAPSGNTRYDRVERQRLAQSIQNAILASAGRSNYGVKEDNFAVIRETDMPSVLIETAFISNLEEEMLLGSDGFRDKMAYGIANGLENYFAK